MLLIPGDYPRSLYLFQKAEVGIPVLRPIIPVMILALRLKDPLGAVSETLLHHAHGLVETARGLSLGIRQNRWPQTLRAIILVLPRASLFSIEYGSVYTTMNLLRSRTNCKTSALQGIHRCSCSGTDHIQISKNLALRFHLSTRPGNW